MTKLLKLALVGMVLVAVAAPVVRLHYTGYCFSEGRFLSDREKIRVAAEWMLRWGASDLSIYPQPDGGGEQVTARMVRSWTVPEFLAAHPDCCRIGAAGPPDMLPINAGRPRTTNVVVDVPVRLAGQDPTERPSIARTVVTVSACGEVREAFRFRRVAQALWRPTHG